MKKGRIHLGSEAVPVFYEITNEIARNKLRTISGTLELIQVPVGKLAAALSNMDGANLITEDGQVAWIEFTRSNGGKMYDFKVLPPEGFVV